MRVLRLVLILAAALLAGCAGAPAPGPASHRATTGDEAGAPTGVLLERIHGYDKARFSPVFESPAGVDWYQDGTLYVCDEKAGRVHGLDPATDRWFQFDQPDNRYYQPVDVCIEGFKVLVLDRDGRSLLRYNLGGVYQDQLVNFIHLDPALERVPAAFDVDRDGRQVYCDAREDQILLVDAAYALQDVVGGHGTHWAQFREPAGVAWLPDGGFVVSDRANSRLQRFTGLGYPDGGTGRDLEPDSPLMAPQGLDVGPRGALFVADPAAGTVHVYDRTLRHLFSFGNELDPDQSLIAPVDVAVGPDDRLAVSDRGRRAVLVYRILRR